MRRRFFGVPAGGVLGSRCASRSKKDAKKEDGCDVALEAAPAPVPVPVPAVPAGPSQKELFERVDARSAELRDAMEHLRRCGDAAEDADIAVRDSAFELRAGAAREAVAYIDKLGAAEQKQTAGQRAAFADIVSDHDGRPGKQELLGRLQTLRDELHEVEDNLDDAKHEALKAERRGKLTAHHTDEVARIRPMVYKCQKALERQEGRVAQAGVHYYPELRLDQDVRAWGGLLCQRNLGRDYSDLVKLESSSHSRHTVQKARRGDGSWCVLKFFDVRASAQLLRETRLLQRMQHACVAEVTCVFQVSAPAGWMLEMPFYAGGDLGQCMPRVRKEGPARVRQVVHDVAQGLLCVHRNGVIHCDVKPANVFLDTGGHARLGDFDISKESRVRAAATAAPTTMATAAGAAGTRGYMAPEVEEGKRATFASDVFSLGLILYDLSGSGAHTRPHTPAVPVVSDKTVNPDAVELLKAMLAKQPSARPSAEEVALDEFFRKSLPPPPTPAPAAPRPAVPGPDPALVPPAHWRNTTALGELVDVTGELRAAMQEMVNRTCVVGQLGQGRDNKGANHKGLLVRRVLRVEHVAVWKQYQFQKQQLLDKHRTQIVQPGAAKHRTPPTVKPLSSFAPSSHSHQLLSRVNEVHLLHGTKRDVGNIIVSQGMDERVASAGLHGAALYFAENSSKSDEYMRPADDGLCDLFVCRVLLGTPHLRGAYSKNQRMRRPPCVEGHDSCVQGHPLADSVVAEVPDKPREFVVHDRTCVYPEYLLRIKRVTKPNPTK
eukprot:TRINITY_DN2040_c0_g1_i6.p1 TRINITY_DN2040_c0_g1~~TRINITY_DN2040_c0_g1_i6.p1  ORF type:complete len:879 (+),score=232.66 TRINITY_DN2040_c0_g1_i6:315-2639(+)